VTMSRVRRRESRLLVLINFCLSSPTALPEEGGGLVDLESPLPGVAGPDTVDQNPPPLLRWHAHILRGGVSSGGGETGEGGGVTWLIQNMRVSRWSPI
jgi:hypothetical protein